MRILEVIGMGVDTGVGIDAAFGPYVESEAGIIIRSAGASCL